MMYISLRTDRRNLCISFPSCFIDDKQYQSIQEGATWSQASQCWVRIMNVWLFALGTFGWREVSSELCKLFHWFKKNTPKTQTKTKSAKIPGTIPSILYDANRQCDQHYDAPQYTWDAGSWAVPEKAGENTVRSSRPRPLLSPACIPVPNRCQTVQKCSTFLNVLSGDVRMRAGKVTKSESPCTISVCTYCTLSQWTHWSRPLCGRRPCTPSPLEMLRSTRYFSTCFYTAGILNMLLISSHQVVFKRLGIKSERNAEQSVPYSKGWTCQTVFRKARAQGATTDLYERRTFYTVWQNQRRPYNALRLSNPFESFRPFWHCRTSAEMQYIIILKWLLSSNGLSFSSSKLWRAASAVATASIHCATIRVTHVQHIRSTERSVIMRNNSVKRAAGRPTSKLDSLTVIPKESKRNRRQLASIIDIKTRGSTNNFAWMTD